MHHKILHKIILIIKNCAAHEGFAYSNYIDYTLGHMILYNIFKAALSSISLRL